MYVFIVSYKKSASLPSAARILYVVFSSWVVSLLDVDISYPCTIKLKRVVAHDE